ncbi:hypothetical protein F2Q70_00034049 [Brassica cretica]|uniref:Uncharacterized protein n=1 Tax=Brassica cretica TaxID=69181 RepID=A0A8S9K0Y7_BRACR|nr:hypothetical protein F2Q70_00034049 [Brassica cretica]
MSLSNGTELSSPSLPLILGFRPNGQQVNNNTFSSLDNVMTNQNHLLMDMIPSREDSTSFSTMLPWNSIRQDPLQMGGFEIFNSFLTNKQGQAQ